MEYIKDTKEFTSPPSVVVLGNFDGIHIGHRKLICKASKLSRELGLKSLVLTFDPHPSFVLANKEPVDLIYLSCEKERLLSNIDIFVEYPYDLVTAKMTPENFIKKVICKQLNAKFIVVGNDYRFGHERKGDINLLKKLSSKYGYELISIPKIAYNNNIVSSTWIRKEIKQGNIKLANKLLGENFSITGKVVEGKKNGRKFGFPTANIIPHRYKILPPNGVYYSNISVNGKKYDSITNVGVNPTLNGQKKVVETHILGFDEDIYGQVVVVEFIQFIRKEKKFNSIEELKKEVSSNIEYVTSLINE
ncbi:bifunctional riboflavin kinase/FAD synthetase [Vallitalea sp.]|jgi:riboflavin kinase/FMN adenylyltransferase|uniref:bifunctional riboflavin kinase/FAD synthetase n=1 Tax=Vallitalea sp. TaxID=1882829 RepID=UPI0025D01D4E|nr:bifunctional riboflavin kinase/FAD synthetase [Vallitalea sp.]MCT4687425.1 bifunctional riboflavin kinase/FAD synthetase [Vallitalea sp.]